MDRDTRDSPLDSHRGSYLTFQEFLSSKAFGAEAEFNRLDLSNSSYYGFDKNRFVLARNTRYGQERAHTDRNPCCPCLNACTPAVLRRIADSASTRPARAIRRRASPLAELVRC